MASLPWHHRAQCPLYFHTLLPWSLYKLFTISATVALRLVCLRHDKLHSHAASTSPGCTLLALHGFPFLAGDTSQTLNAELVNSIWQQLLFRVSAFQIVSVWMLHLMTGLRCHINENMACVHQLYGVCMPECFMSTMMSTFTPSNIHKSPISGKSIVNS